jgi:hypothetical protein
MRSITTKTIIFEKNVMFTHTCNVQKSASSLLFAQKNKSQFLLNDASSRNRQAHVDKQANVCLFEIAFEKLLKLEFLFYYPLIQP